MGEDSAPETSTHRCSIIGRVWKAAPVALVLMAGLVAACGGSSGDQALADKAVLRSGDLPSAGEGVSWYSDPPDDEALINSCVDFDLPGHVVTASAAADNFISSQIGEVTSLAAVYEGPAASALGPVAERLTSCIRQRAAWKVRQLSFPRLGAAARALEGRAIWGRDEVVLMVKGRSLAVIWYSPELGCGGRLCGATREQKTAFVHDVLVGMARHLAARM